MATFPLAADGRFLVKADGTQFRYVADTPWLLPKLDQADIVTLVADRKAKGFTALQISLLVVKVATYGYTDAYGAAPFVGAAGTWDLAQPLLVGAAVSSDTDPDYDYWDHVDFIVNHLAAEGMLAALVPCWYGPQGRDWRGYLTAANAATYGAFLGGRYGGHTNVAWLHGGDNDPVGNVADVPAGLDTADKVVATGLLADAIVTASTVSPLQSYHTDRGASPYADFGAESWYTLHGAYSTQFTYARVIDEYNLARVLPVVLLESYYDARAAAPILGGQELRAQLYWAVTRGAAGVAYGHEGIWDMTGFPADLAAASADDVTTLVGLLATFGGNLLRPDARPGFRPTMLTSGYGTAATNGGIDLATSAVASDRSHGICYFPNTRGSIVVNLSMFNRANVDLSWFNPADGTSTAIGSFAGTGTQAVTYPASGFTDAVLVAVATGADIRPTAKSDTFQGLSSAVWAETDPVGDTTISESGSDQLSMAVTTTAAHDLNASVSSAPMYLQDHEGDFDVTIKVDSIVNGVGASGLRGAGIVACVSPTGDHIRLATFDTSSITQRIYFGKRVAGVQTNYYSSSPAGIPQPVYLRLIRVGDVWRAFWGATDVLSSMTQVGGDQTQAVASTELGVLALSNTFAYTALVDSFEMAEAPESPPPTTGGSAAGVWSFTGAASGSRPSQGTGTGSWSFTGSAAGASARSGSATGSWSFTGAAAGTSTHSGTGAGSWSFAGAASGSRPSQGAATGSWSFAGAADGTAAHEGTGTGSWVFTGAAAGEAPVEGEASGSASGSWSFTGSASGSSTRSGTAAGTWAWAGSSAGSTVNSGTATGLWQFAGAAAGDSAPPDPLVHRPDTGTVTRIDSGTVTRPNAGTVTRPRTYA